MSLVMFSKIRTDTTGPCYFSVFPELLKTYSLRSELLVAKMDVSRCILVLDTSISETNNFERREYLAARAAVDWRRSWI